MKLHVFVVFHKFTEMSFLCISDKISTTKNKNKNNNNKKYMCKWLRFKSAQQHTGKVNTSSIIKQNIYYLWKCTVN